MLFIIFLFNFRDINFVQLEKNFDKKTAMFLSEKIKQQQHPFHLVDASPWPMLVSISLFHVVCFFTSILNDAFILSDILSFNPIISILFPHNICYFSLYFLGFIFFLFEWFYNIILEATYRGQHSTYVQSMLLAGFIFFVVSEVMFFFSFFWSFFHLSVSPSAAIGGIWPPAGIKTIEPLGLPYLNTLILIFSGVFVTWCHMAFLEEQEDFYFMEIENITNSSYFYFMFDYLESANTDFGFKKKLVCLFSLFATIILGAFFTSLQLFEYNYSLFDFSDSAFGGIFYIMTGFHGVHVLVGTIFLIVSFIRMYYNEFTPRHHIGLESAILYWHFVDVVWLGLYISLYCWGI